MSPTTEQLLKYAVTAIGSALVAALGAVWVAFRVALRAKLAETIRAETAPQFAALHQALDAKADTADVVALEQRFEERTRPFLAGIEENSERTARGVEALNDRMGQLAERLSRMEGAWDGITDRRRGLGRPPR